MSMEEKRTSAMRLFQALSCVDEELLIKADENIDEKIVKKEPVGSKIVSFAKSRYAGTLVAAACIMLVCLALWQTGGYQYATKESATDAAAPEAAMEEMAAPAAAAPESEMVEEAAPAEEAEKAMGSDSGSKGTNASQDLFAKTEAAELKESINIQDSPVVSGSQPCLKYPYTEISEEEARAIAELGEYVPNLLPAGYVWESGAADIEEETGECKALYLTWCRGMDSISITVKKADKGEVQLTDVEETESYNVHLYEIPYADTVPDKYYESFHQPVFGEEDFCFELVDMRMKVIADAGDTDTPRGDFSIYYDEGVLVRFNGRGTAKEIWEMFKK